MREQRERRRGGPGSGRQTPTRALHHRHTPHAHGGHAVPGHPESHRGDIATLQPALSTQGGTGDPKITPGTTLFGEQLGQEAPFAPPPEAGV